MKGKKGFTLIELMIVITIIGIITIVSYAPYNYYKNKAKLKDTANKITQLLSESRNKAINGTIGENGNVSIGVYFDSSNLNNKKINIYLYPYDYDVNMISYIENSDIKKIKTLKLDKGIELDSIEGGENLLFYFDAITGKVTYYRWDGPVRTEISDKEIDINFSYKGSTNRNLNKTISYFTYTNVIDY